MPATTNHHASLVSAVCDLKFRRARKLVRKHSIDINLPSFRVGNGLRTMPLLHACLYRFLCGRYQSLEEMQGDEEGCERALRMILDFLVRDAGARAFVNSLHVVDSPHDKTPFCFRWFNPLDFVWMAMRSIAKSSLGLAVVSISLEQQEPWQTAFMHNLNLIRAFFAKMAVLVQSLVGDRSHESNGGVLRMLCCMYEVGIVRTLLDAGIGQEAWVTRGVVERIFSPSSMFAFLVSDCEGLLRLLLDHRGGLFASQDLMSILVNWYGSVKDDLRLASVIDEKAVSLVRMLLCAGMDSRQAERAVRRGAFRHSAQTFTDPMQQLLICRRGAVVKDDLDRRKMDAFLQCRGGRLGLDIVQSHIQPYVVTLGGFAQQRLDALLDGEGILRGDESRECAFYYFCLLRNWVDDPHVAWEFRFMEYLRTDEGSAEIDDLLVMLRRVFPNDEIDANDAVAISRRRFARGNGMRVDRGVGVWPEWE